MLRHVRLFVTPQTACSPPDPPVHGIFQQRYWSGLPFPSPADLPDPGLEAGSPVLQADSLPTKAIRETTMTILPGINKNNRQQQQATNSRYWCYQKD